MTVKDIVGQMENLFGRQSEAYVMRLINDAFLDMSPKVQHHTKISTQTLRSYKRLYDLDDDVIDIFRIEIKDTNDRDVMIPKLADPHKLLKEDTDEEAGSQT